ncbi:MAG: ribonuclease R [Deltaproteobacteria bacterium]
MIKQKKVLTLNKENLLKVLKDSGRPVSLKELEKVLQISKSERRSIRVLIKDLLKEGAVIMLKSGMYGIPQEMNLQSGTLWCTRSGNGFLISEKEGEKDIFIPSGSIKDAFHGDKVIARIEHTVRGKKEGKVIKVIERKTKNITGYAKQLKNIWYVVSEDGKVPHHFIIENSSYKQVAEGSLVAGQILKYPEEGKDPTCKIVKVFKGLNDVKSITQFVAFKHNLPQRFKKTVEAEIKEVRTSVETDHDRVDLRALKHVTIDGEFAKDFDDAVFIEKVKDGYELYVSIADVSHYVLPGTALDAEAYERGTSTYFPGTVIPMLPKILSNVICSLNPDEERLTMTAKMTFSKDGTLTGTSFCKSLIKSAMRLTYTKVEKALIHKDKKTRNDLKTVMPELELMKELAEILAEKRNRRGSLDFDLPEPEVILDIEGGVKGIIRSERLFAHKIIEEFMIAANEAVAQYLFKNKIPAIYRIHEHPDREKLIDFERLLQNLPVNYKKVNVTTGYLQSLLKSVSGSQYEFLINKTLLKSMKQAKYSASNKGHFGLASDCYLHFTSPIRRYPDLVCHRALKHALANHAKGEKGGLFPEQELDRMAIHLSDRERVAMEAERELEDRIKVFFMKDKLGEVYEGIVSHITSFGFFVELLDFFVEGLVLLSELHDDYYIFQEDKFRLMGRRTKKTYRIGDKVKVKVALADIEQNRLHFSLIKEGRSRTARS